MGHVYYVNSKTIVRFHSTEKLLTTDVVEDNVGINRYI